MQVSASPVPEMSGDVSWALEGPSPPYINGWERFVSPFSAIIPTPLFCKLPECYLPFQIFRWTQPVRAKAVQPHTFPTEQGKRHQKGTTKVKERANTHQTPPAPVSTTSPPCSSPDQAAAQSRLSAGFAFLGKHQAPLIQASSSPAKNNPLSCCLIYTSPWMRGVFYLVDIQGERERGCVCSLPLMFPVRFGPLCLQVCLFHYFSKPADFLMELLIFFLADPPGEARQRTNEVHSELQPEAALLLPGPRGIEGFHCTGQISPFSSLQVLDT